VINSSVNTTSEPGSNAEWYLTFNVNGQTAQWSDEYVKDDKIYAINRDFDVDLKLHTKVVIRVNGYEQDDTSANDQLPTLEQHIDPAQDWQIGGTYTVASPETIEGSYKIDYTVTCAEPHPLKAAREYVGVYRAGTGGYGRWAGNWESFTKRWNLWSSQGLRLARISTFRRDKEEWTFGDASERIFVGIFAPGTDDYALWVSPWPQFEAKWHELSGKGLRLVDLAPYKDNGNRMFAGVFRAGHDPYALWCDQWSGFEAKWMELSAKGLRLVSLDTYVDGGKRYFTGVYRAGSDSYTLWVGVDWQSFKAKWMEFAKRGLRLVDIASYPEQGGKQLFAGAFRAGKDNHALIGPVTWEEFVKNWQSQSAESRRLVSLDTFTYGQEE
jgi:hypothetical protein